MIDAGAVISSCGQFRYRLWRQWAPGPVMLFVMLNPSTADGEKDDPTIRKCIGFAKQAGFSGIEVLNLYAYRATKPADLAAAGYPQGPENERELLAAASRSRDQGLPMVCAWGAEARKRSWYATDVARWLHAAGANLRVLSRTHDDIPRHPLYLSYSSTLSQYTP